MKRVWLRTGVFVVTLFLASALALNFSACRRGSGDYHLGVIAPLTGDGATYGAAMKKGIDLALSQINGSGGINQHKLIAEYQDSRLSPQTAIGALRYLATTKKIPIVLGPAASSVAFSLVPVANSLHVVLFSSISTADALRGSPGDYFFRNVPPNRVQARTAASFTTQYLHKKRVVILYQNNDYGSGMEKEFSKAFQASSGLIVHKETFDAGQMKYRSVLTKIAAAKPEVIYVPGTYHEVSLILKQARDLDIRAIFLSGDGAYSPALLRTAGPAADGMFLTMMSLPRVGTNVNFDNFLHLYEGAYHEEPNVYATYSYDAVFMVRDAIIKGGYTGEGIRAALEKLQYNGVTGPTKFDDYGDVNKPYSIYEVVNGKFQLLRWSPKSAE